MLINLAIDLTLIFAFVFIVTAFVSFVAKQNHFTKTAIAPTRTPAKTITQTTQETKPEPRPIPQTIREIREFIRIHNLQETVKQSTGKTVSKCTKDELIAAIA